jgi:cytochrome c2
VADAQVENDLRMRDFTMEKAVRDQARSFYEEALEQNGGNENAAAVREAKDKTAKQADKVDGLNLRKQESDAKLADARARLQAIVGRERELQGKIKLIDDKVNLISKRLKELSDPLIRAVTTAPLLEFAASPFKVEQIETDHHHIDVNFATVPRVDRCTTCHKGIDRKDLSPEELQWRTQHKIAAVEWSKLPQPLAGHPRLDLFVGDNSPHPASTYGCTVCHWGWDRETTFSRAGHTPDVTTKRLYAFNQVDGRWVEAAAQTNGEAGAASIAPKKDAVEMTQQAAWQKNHHWEEEEFLLQPMRQAKFIQASCLKCHSDQTNLEGGEKLDHGRRLIEQLGCWSCHKMRQLETYSTHQVAAGEDFDSICKLYEVDPDEVRKLNSLPSQPALRVGQDLSIPIRTLRKVGPSLFKIAGKTNKDWVRNWLENPVAFKPNTYMPRFWGLDNNKDTPGRNATEINAVSEFLFTVSQPTQYPEPPVKGDAENGKKLVGQLGCMACHVIDERLMDLQPPAPLAPYMDEWQYRRFRSQGPQLAGTGSKTSPGWIYAWLKDPKQYHPKTKMPNLRLSDPEAADIAEYLAGLHNEKTDQEQLSPSQDELLDSVALEYLQASQPIEQAKQTLADPHGLDSSIEMYFTDYDTMQYYQDPTRMAREEAKLKALQKQYQDELDDAVGRQAKQLEDRLKQVKVNREIAAQKVASLGLTEKKNLYLGSKLVGRYGCFACHDIHGFEDAKPIGTELSEWGAKSLTQIDFGLLDIEHKRIAFLEQKLHAPRSFDIGRVGVTRMPLELLRMPKFNLTDDQIEQIVTVITGMTNEKLLPNEAQQLTPAQFAIERGRWAVKELNCEGCHQVEGKGWAIRATGIAQGMEPPMISGLPTQLQEGQRVQPDWFFGFLKAPQTGEIRPWLKVRMPTFGFSDSEANVLVKYFALEGRTQFPYQTSKAITAPEHLAAGKQMFTQLKCALCHIVEGRALGKPLAEIPEDDLPRLAPNLSLAHARLQRDWLVNKWLPDPLSQYPGTRMPQFEYGANLAPNVLGGDGRQQTEALVDYVLSLGAPHEQAAQPPPTAEKQP